MLVQHVDPKPAPTMAPSSSVTSVPSISRISSPPAPSAPVISAAPSNSNGILQRKRSTSKKMSKDVVVTNAQPMGAMPTTGKFANLPSPGMINSLEAQKAAQSPPTAQGNTSTPISQSSTLMSVSDTSQSVQTDRSNGRPSISDDQAPTPRANKRQSSVPPRQYTPAYLTKLSTDGLSAPPGSMPDTRDRDRDRKAKSGRFWPSFGKTPEKITRPVFGVPLNESLAIASVASLPAVVFRCIEWLEINKAQDEEGVYRMSGSSAVIKGLKDRFDLEGDVNLVKLDERWDPHAIAGLLKTFLRELPTSLLTRELHPKFLAVMGTSIISYPYSKANVRFNRLVRSSSRIDKTSLGPPTTQLRPPTIPHRPPYPHCQTFPHQQNDIEEYRNCLLPNTRYSSWNILRTRLAFRSYL